MHLHRGIQQHGLPGHHRAQQQARVSDALKACDGVSQRLVDPVVVASSPGPLNLGRGRVRTARQLGHGDQPSITASRRRQVAPPSILNLIRSDLVELELLVALHSPDHLQPPAAAPAALDDRRVEALEARVGAGREPTHALGGQRRRLHFALEQLEVPLPQAGRDLRSDRRTALPSAPYVVTEAASALPRRRRQRAARWRGGSHRRDGSVIPDRAVRLQRLRPGLRRLRSPQPTPVPSVLDGDGREVHGTHRETPRVPQELPLPLRRLRQQPLQALRVCGLPPQSCVPQS
mmetsp:Transcript_160097/g.513660  ORF Transcript_160097/g.513660 Transcript_160097/m.513660 type:complete len:290 (+) Transcript_160097:1055-1924(+)